MLETILFTYRSNAVDQEDCIKTNPKKQTRGVSKVSNLTTNAGRKQGIESTHIPSGSDRRSMNTQTQNKRVSRKNKNPFMEIKQN